MEDSPDPLMRETNHDLQGMSSEGSLHSNSDLKKSLQPLPSVQCESKIVITTTARGDKSSAKKKNHQKVTWTHPLQPMTAFIPKAIQPLVVLVLQDLFVHPVISVQLVEEFFSKTGCPEAVSCTTSKQPLFSYLDTTALNEQDKEELEQILVSDTREIIILFADQ